jgi:hypothetical protein
MAYSPPLGDICVLSIGIRAQSLILGFTALRANMLDRGLVHNNTFIFNVTNYHTWKIHMLNYFWIMDPTIEQIVDTGFSPPKDTQNISLEVERNLYRNAQAIHLIVNALSDVMTCSITPFRSAQEI